MRKQKLLQLPWIAWSVFLAIAILMPSDQIPKSKLFSYDKLIHLGVFACHSFLLCWAKTDPMLFFGRKIKWALAALTISIVYGAALEYLQQFVPGRMTDAYDLLANIFGAVLGTIVFITFSKISLRFLN